MKKMVRQLSLATQLFVIGMLSAGNVYAEKDIIVNGLQRVMWGKKLSGGAIKVIFMARYSEHQDSYELMQRFEFEGTVIPVAFSGENITLKRWSGAYGHYWPSLLVRTDEVPERIRKALKSDWDVMVLGSISGWSKYPDDIRKLILKSVLAGKAIMIPELKGDFEADLKAAGVKLETLDTGKNRFPFSDKKKGETIIYKCGKGRVVHFSVPARALSGYLLSDSIQADFEYSAARAGWFIKQVAKPGSTPFISSTKVENSTLTVATSTAASIKLSHLNLKVRDYNSYETVLEKGFKLKRRKHTYATILPHLPTGKYQAEVIAFDSKGCSYDWDALVFSVKNQVNIKNITIDPAQSVHAGQKLNGKVTIQGAADKLNMQVKWYDQWNRLLLATKPVPFSDTFTIDAPDGSYSVLNRIEVSLLSESAIEDIATAEVLMPDNIRAEDFYMITWQGSSKANSWRNRLYNDALRREGAFDTFSHVRGSKKTGSRDELLSNVRTVPIASWLKLKSIEQLFDSDWLSRVENGARKNTRNHKYHAPLAYTIGDEIAIARGHFSDKPVIWQAFQEYLKKTYPNIKSLNSQWNTDFTDWKDIYFKDEKAMLPSMENPSAWTDFRLFINNKYAKLIHNVHDAIKEEDPDAWIGHEGAEQYNSYDGYDYWQMNSGLEMINVYCGYLIPYVFPNKIFNGEATKSFSPDAKLSGVWMNQTDRQYGGEYTAWHLVLNKWNSIWWWLGHHIHPANGALTWNLSPTTVLKPTVKAVKEIKKGAATLIAHAQKEMDPIAVHYSANNWLASGFESGAAAHVNKIGLQEEWWMAPDLMNRWGNDSDELKDLWGGIEPKGHYASASKNFYLLLHDLGFQPVTMARQQIEADTLTKQKIKVLILPFVSSLSDLEVEKIRSFVENGGTVIADYRCGFRDIHGKLRPEPALDDVFGIKRLKGSLLRSRSSVVFSETYTGAKFENIFHEPIASLESKSYGLHDDGIPACTVNKYGKGKAIYLNTDMNAYYRMRKRGTERGLREFCRNLLRDEADLTASFVPEYKYGHPLGALEVTRFKDGDNRYYGVLPDFTVDDKSIKTASLHFPEGMHVYNIREQTYLGNTSPVYQDIEPGKAQLYAALPYKIESINVVGPKNSKRGQRVDLDLNVICKNDKIEPHTVYIEVIWPDGSKPEYGAKTLYMPEGKGKYSFFPAFNSPVGKWMVSVTEVVSGVKESTNIEIK